MTISARILLLIPSAGIALRALRVHFQDIGANQLDAAIIGMKSSGAITIALGIAMRPVIAPADRRTYIRSGIDPVAALLKTRARGAKWRRANGVPVRKSV